MSSKSMYPVYHEFKEQFERESQRIKDEDRLSSMELIQIFDLIEKFGGIIKEYEHGTADVQDVEGVKIDFDDKEVLSKVFAEFEK